MKFYEFNEIRAKGSCVDFAEQVLGAKVVDGRCAAVWRNGTNKKSISIEKDKWFDQSEKIGGGLIELCAFAKFKSIDDNTRQLAQEFLGEWLNLQPAVLKKMHGKKSKHDDLIEDGYVEKARYNYTDIEGNTVYFVCRLEHAETGKKEFLQGTPNGWGLGDVKPVPYNWSAISESAWVIIVEGEKDVETLKTLGLPATTNSGGAKRWLPEFAQYLSGKKVIILPDNDEVGKDHAELIAKDCFGIAESVKIVQCSKLPKGDVTDYLERESGTHEGLMEMIKAAPFYDPANISEVDEAKRANKKPFCNYWMEEIEQPGTRPPKKERQPWQMLMLVEDLHTRLLGAPFRVGEQMFDQDRETGQIDYIYDTSSLFSWITCKTKCVVDWAKIGGCVTKSEFFEALRSNAVEYSAVSFTPDWPVRDDVFYAHPEMPKPTEGHSAFWRFVDFFKPVDEVNRRLIASLIMAPIFYKPMVDKPLWIIDSPHGQGSGKSKIPEMIAFLYGRNLAEGKPIDVSVYDLEKNYQEVVKRIISTTGRNSRILRLDNVTGILRSSNLSTLVTTGSISGRASYGRGEESRPNNLTYVVTINGATVDTDIASRAYYIMVAKPKMDAHWKSNVIDYIEKNRMQIFSDIVDLLSRHSLFDCAPSTRTPEFETMILQPACETLEMYNETIEFIMSKKEETNNDEEIARCIEEEIESRLADVKTLIGAPVITSDDKVFIRSNVIEEWFRGKSWIDKHAISVIRNMAKTGMLAQVCPATAKWPHHATKVLDRRNGIMWNFQAESDARVIGVENKVVIEVPTQI